MSDAASLVELSEHAKRIANWYRKNAATEERTLQSLPGASTTKAMGDPKAAIMNIRSLSPDAALEAVIAGKHLKRAKDGQYIGAPRGVDAPKKLAAWREARYQEFLDAHNAVPDASTWYRRALTGTQEAAGLEPYAQYRLAREHAQFSNQANLDTNSEFTYKAQHDYQNAIRGNNVVRTGDQYDRMVEGRRTGKTPLGMKTEPYSTKFDPTLGTHDFDPATGRLIEGAAGTGRSMRSTVAGGNVNDTHHKGWLHGEDAPDTWTPQEHAFSDAEMILFADRANREKVGGKNDWDVGQVQATRWVLQKAQGMLARGEVDSIEKGYEEALKEYSEFFWKYGAFHTNEPIPGRLSNHHPDMLTAPNEFKEKYARDVMENFSNPHGDGRFRDQLYDDAGIAQLPMMVAQGSFTDSGGFTAHNPVLISRPLVHHRPDVPTQFIQKEKVPGGKDNLHVIDDTDVGIGDSARNNMQANTEDRAYDFVQDGGAASKPIFNAKKRNQGGIHFTTGQRLTPDQMDQIKAVTSAYDLPDVVDYSQSAIVNRFWPKPVDSVRVKEALAELKKKLPNIVSHAGEPKQVRIDSVYADYSDAFNYANEGKGVVTQQCLDAMRTIPGAYDIRNNNPLRAARLGWLADKSDAIAPVVGAPRSDVQNPRRIGAANPTQQLDAFGRALDQLKAIREQGAKLRWSDEQTNAAAKKAGVWLPVLGLFGLGLNRSQEQQQGQQAFRAGYLGGNY